MDSANTDEGCSLRTRWVTIAVLVAVHLAAATAIALVPFGGEHHHYQNRPIIGVILGTLFAQMSLTAAWCTLGPGQFFVRVPFSLMAASLLGLAMAAFTFKSSGGDEFWLFAALTLVGWLLLQPPLWIASGLYRYSVRLPDEESREKAAAQFSLAHMLLWTLGVAVVLGIGRMALRDFQITNSHVYRGGDLAIMMVLLTLNFLLAMPIIHFALRRTASFLVLLLVGVWSLILGGVECVILSAIAGPPPPDAFVLVLLMNLVHGLLLAGSLLALTSLGYRLRPKPPLFRQLESLSSKD
jgi:hypothetical protein